MAIGQKLRGVSGELWWNTVKVAALTNYDLTIAGAEADASDHDSSSWGETMATTFKWSLTVTAWYLDGDTAQATLRSDMIAAATHVGELRPNGTGSGKSKFYGNARITGVKLGAPQNGVQPHDITLTGVGALTEGTQT
jgi:hypothetical protein